MKSAWLIAVLLALNSPIIAQDTTDVYPGAVVCGGWVVPDSAVGGVYRCQANGGINRATGRNDLRQVANVVGYVRVVARALPPPPALTAQWTYACAGLACTFDGSASTGATTWAWQTLSGLLLSTERVFSRTFQAAGQDSIRLVVGNAAGALDTLTQLVVVGSPPPPPPDTVPPPPSPPPPVDTVPPPPPDTTPTGWREVFRDDFETGNLTLATGGYRWGISQAGAGDGQPRVVTALAHSGTRVLAFTYGGNADPADDGWSEQRFVFGANLTDVRLSWWQFFPADFTIRDAPGTDNLKWLILWDDVYETYRVLLGLNFDRGSGGFQGITRQGVNGRELGGSSFWRPGLTAGMLGRWIFVELEAGVATGGQANGRLILTVDGQVVIDRRDFPIAGATKNYLKNGYLMGWANAGFSKTTVVYVDDFRVLVR